MSGEKEESVRRISLKSSKPISEVKQGDRMKVNGKNLEVDAHYVFMEHSPTTKEMIIELVDPEKEEFYQLRYFSDQVKESMQLFKLEAIIYKEVELKSVEW